MRLVHLSSFPAEGVPIRLAGSAQIGGVEIAVPVEHFAEPERDRRARRARKLSTDPSAEFSTKTDKRLSLGCFLMFTRRSRPKLRNWSDIGAPSAAGRGS